jgi:hypothetical protein
MVYGHAYSRAYPGGDKMREMDKAMWWCDAWYWNSVTANQDPKKRIKVLRRKTWAMHRFNSAAREMYKPNNCPYCDDPYHDESEKPCWKRVEDVKKAELFGRMMYPRLSKP